MAKIEVTGCSSGVMVTIIEGEFVMTFMLKEDVMRELKDKLSSELGSMFANRLLAQGDRNDRN